MKPTIKKLFSIIAASAIAVSMLPATFAANDDIKVIVDGTELKIAENDTKPFVEDGRTLVPMRAIFEALGATVEWDDVTKTVTSKSDNGNIEMQVGSDTIKINGANTKVDVPAKINESNRQREDIQRQISDLRSQQSSLGFFKGKEKKILQTQIDDAQFRLKKVPSQQEIQTRYKPRIDQIYAEKQTAIDRIKSDIQSRYTLPKLEDFVDEY